MIRFASVLASLAVVACGRAGPGATLTTRKDPDVEAHELRDRECTRLRAYESERGKDRDATSGFHCDEWKVKGVEQVAAVRPDAVPPHTGPAPQLGAVASLAIGRGVAGSGGSDSAAYWLDAGVQLQWVPRPDRFALYVSPAYFAVGDQSDLSGVSFTGGAMLALTAGWTIEAHGGAVTADHLPWRAGASIRWRPQHLTSYDWTVHLAVEHVRGDDVMRTVAPYVLEPNHATGVLLGFSGGVLP